MVSTKEGERVSWFVSKGSQGDKRAYAGLKAEVELEEQVLVLSRVLNQHREECHEKGAP